MNKKKLIIDSIPSILWGGESEKLFIAVHGNMSNKEDDVIALFAEEATAKGYRVLSFDLPEHGDRKSEQYACAVQNCIHDLEIIMHFAREQSGNIGVFACSIGAYFSLLAYRDFPIEQCLFLSPILNMERIIQNMMTCFGVSEEMLESEKEIMTPIGQPLIWDYYRYVKSHPIDIWDTQTAILYGSGDDLSEFDVVTEFSDKFGCNLTVLNNGEHYFHSEEQLQFFRHWLKEYIGLNKQSKQEI